MDAKPSPLPWQRIHGEYTDRNDCEVRSSSGLVAKCNGCDNAALIVASVNAMPKMVEALREMMDAVQTFHGEPGWEIYRDNAPEMIHARAALALAPARESKAGGA